MNDKRKPKGDLSYLSDTLLALIRTQHKTTPTASQNLLIEARLGTNKGLSVEIKSHPTGIVNLLNGKKVSPEPRGTKNVFSDIRVLSIQI